MANKDTCYMCEFPASGNEHIPPKCFFPKAKDTPHGENLRVQLLTVPSCDEHNSSKSKDDEYVCFVVSFHFENNLVGAHSAAQKFIRAINYSQSLVHILKDPIRISIRGQPTVRFQVDANRVDRVFDHMARGIYYDHFGDKHFGSVAVIYPSTFLIGRPQLDRLNPTYREWLNKGQSDVSSSERNGANQAAFYYQALAREEEGWALIRLVFFEGLVVDCLLTDL